MKIARQPLLGLLLSGLIGAAGAAPAQQAALEAETRFEGTLSQGPGLAAAEPLRVHLQNWALRGGQKVDRFPVEGFRLIQLLAGEVTTVIGGQRVERKEGEFWTVPAGTAMTIETEDDTAVLQVLTVEAP